MQLPLCDLLLSGTYQVGFQSGGETGMPHSPNQSAHLICSLVLKALSITVGPSPQVSLSSLTQSKWRWGLFQSGWVMEN